MPVVLNLDNNTGTYDVLNPWYFDLLNTNLGLELIYPPLIFRKNSENIMKIFDRSFLSLISWTIICIWMIQYAIDYEFGTKFKKKIVIINLFEKKSENKTYQQKRRLELQITKSNSSLYVVVYNDN